MIAYAHGHVSLCINTILEKFCELSSSEGENLIRLPNRVTTPKGHEVVCKLVYSIHPSITRNGFPSQFNTIWKYYLHVVPPCLLYKIVRYIQQNDVTGGCACPISQCLQNRQKLKISGCENPTTALQNFRIFLFSGNNVITFGSNSYRRHHKRRIVLRS